MNQIPNIEETHNTREDLRQHILKEMNSRRVDGKTYIDSAWLLSEYDNFHHQELQKAREEAWVDGFMETREGYNGEYCGGHGGNYVTREVVHEIYQSGLD